MINIYSPDDLQKIRDGGKITAIVLQKVLNKISPGISTATLDKYAESLIRDASGTPSFMMEPRYRWATCLNVNDTVVHGIPGGYQLQKDDRLGVDLGTYYQGFHTDASWSVLVGANKTASEKFLAVGQMALKLAIKECFPGNRVGRVSQAIQKTIEAAGYSCVKQLVGHGVGKKLHEDPEIPCYLRGKIEHTPVIKEGMVFAVEVIYNLGKPQVIYSNDDGWTIGTRDGSLSGLFEHTVIVTKNGPEIATAV